MSEPVPLNPQLSRARALATQLEQMLELEFEALRTQDLEQFEQLQPVKSQLLVDLTLLAPPASELQVNPDWQDFRAVMLACRDSHRRNEVLIERKLEAIRGALQSLRVQEVTSSVEVYNRLGHIARFSRTQGYNEA